MPGARTAVIAHVAEQGRELLAAVACGVAWHGSSISTDPVVLTARYVLQPSRSANVAPIGLQLPPMTSVGFVSTLAMGPMCTDGCSLENVDLLTRQEAAQRANDAQ